MSYLKNRKVLLYLTCYTLLILISGVFIGKHLSHKYKHHRHHEWKSHQSSHIDKKVKKFTKTLNLSSEQQHKLSVILTHHKNSIQMMRKRVKIDFKTIRDQRISDINAILNTKQKETFAKMQKKHQKKYRKNNHRRSKESTN